MFEIMIDSVKKNMSLDHLPEINFVEDVANSNNILGKTAFYQPSKKSITVYVTGRHPKDILRSVCHEMIHFEQDLNNKFSEEYLFQPGYAQEDSRLRKLEEEAYLRGNMLFRDWEDEYKKTETNRQMFEGQF